MRLADVVALMDAWYPPQQAESWDSLLGWARRRYDVDFAITAGIIHVAQPPATVDRLAHEVAFDLPLVHVDASARFLELLG